jgi:exosortase J
MSAFPDSDIHVQAAGRWDLSPVRFAVLAMVLAVLGASAIWPAILTLWSLWTTDGLKSIGMVVPVVSVVLIVRAWRRIGWRAEGTWWGFALIALTAVVVLVREQALLILVISPHWSTVVPPPSFVLLAYGAGVVLLAGGVRLFRAALFPILLLWFANPVPSRFSQAVDLPLQHISAHIARSFATHLGHALTPDNLRLMFTPDFGMFIAPGCDGIRGSITMGFIALIAGYFYRFRWYVNAAVVAGAILLGYVFNLVRLCMLVLYYAVALHFPSLQNKAEGADYAIGAILFLCATLMLFLAIHRLRDARDAEAGGTVAEAALSGPPELAVRGQYARLCGLVAMVLIGFAGMARTQSPFYITSSKATGAAGARFPEELGSYKLKRAWNETLDTGAVVYYWAQYAPADGGAPVALGISPVPDWHDPTLCHFVRGEDALWDGQLAMPTLGAPISFSSAFYNDGVVQYLEASTICRGGTCGEFASGGRHFGLVYTRIDPGTLLREDSAQPIRVLLRIETLDLNVPAQAAREQLTADARKFLAAVKLDELTRPYSR